MIKEEIKFLLYVNKLFDTIHNIGVENKFFQL